MFNLLTTGNYKNLLYILIITGIFNYINSLTLRWIGFIFIFNQAIQSITISF